MKSLLLLSINLLWATQSFEIQTTKSKNSSIQKMYVNSKGVLISTPSFSVIYKQEFNSLHYLDHTKKTVTNLMVKDIELAKIKIDQSKKMIQEQLKSLPPGQRQIAEALMKSQLGSTLEIKETILTPKPLSSKTLSDKRTCDLVEFSEKIPVSQICFQQKTPLDPQNQDAFFAMLGFFDKLRSFTFLWKKSPIQFPESKYLKSGFPIEVFDLTSKTHSVLSKPKATTKKGVLVIPSDYKNIALPF